MTKIYNARDQPTSWSYQRTPEITHMGQCLTCSHCMSKVSTLRPIQNDRHFADDIFKCIFMNENFWISNRFSLKYVPYSLLDNKTVLVRVMAWRITFDKSLFEPMMAQLRFHIYASFGLNELTLSDKRAMMKQMYLNQWWSSVFINTNTSSTRFTGSQARCVSDYRGDVRVSL